MINSIKLQGFRNFKLKKFEFSPDTSLILGPNASGKTNLLESLYFLSAAKSFKAKIEEEVISYEKDIARIEGQISDSKSEENDLEIIITRGQIDIGAVRPEKAPRKKLLLNGIPKRGIDFAGNFRVVLFGPWDMDLVTEAPTVRRKFLDMVLSQVNREYRRSVLSYEKGLRQRNRVLWNIREGNVGRDRLLFWNQLLIKNGDYISESRREFIENTNKNNFSPKDIDDADSFSKLQLEYDPSVISEGRLEQYKDEEVASATTLVGPHRDDFIFKRDGRSLSSFGSRGEQRMGVLWLKMAELAFVEQKTDERPTLLLDDIFSELDDSHRGIVVQIANGQQTIITAVDDKFAKDLKKVNKIELIR
ncbi:MAG: DNA replication and repair protein recF [uncultured bacterium]|nr:MAG: DNA replication and repair protein recF [uncultured bacterium]